MTIHAVYENGVFRPLEKVDYPDRSEAEGMGGLAMTKILHGRVRGKTIELDEDLGVAEGQEVEVQITIVPTTLPSPPPMSEGLAKIYEILGERYDSGYTDTAERHNEHQP